MPLPMLPDFEDGQEVALEDLQDIVDYCRAITPIPGGDVTPHVVAGGVMFNGLGSGGGGLLPVKITTTVPAATWGPSGVTPSTGGEGVLVKADGSFGDTIDIKSHYPDAATAPRAGWVTRGPDGAYWLVEVSCSEVDE